MNRIPTLLTIALSALLLLTSTHALTAQLPSPQADPDLVYIRVTVVESSRNSPVRGLSKGEFKVFEDNAPQDIEYFSEDTLPLRMGVLLDVSGTSKEDTTRALSTMTRSGAQGDEFFTLETAKTPLHDSIMRALDALAPRGDQAKLALLVVTSKKEPGSVPLAMVRERLKTLDIQLYVTVLQTSSDVTSDSDRQVIRELAERTGGSAYFPSSSFDQAEIFKRIVRQQKNQYRIGYRPSNQAMDGKWRKVKISVAYIDKRTGKNVKMNVLAKPGYYAPKAVK
jgi:Ca-activated chloride channel homolog